MTAPYKRPHRHEPGDSQWADFGVNVGHAVYGGIHFHPPAVPTARSRRRDATTHQARTARDAAMRSALADLAHAFGRAATALACLWPDEAGKEKR
ncbi:hypothetical protein ACRAWF_09770 [Streptomyces sp. L7]